MENLYFNNIKKNRATEDSIESGGSFDGTGAFLGCDDRHLRSTDTDDIKSSLDAVDRRSGIDDRDHVPSEKNSSDSGDEKSSEHPPNEELSERDESKSVKSRTDVKNLKSSDNIHDDSHEKNLEESSVSQTGKSLHILARNPIMSEVSTNPNADRMKEVADDIEKLIMDDDLSSENDLDPSIKKSLKINDGSVDKINENKSKVAASGAGERKDLWYYRDPQGKVQGPFTATEMLEWYRAGYFDENLHVKRVCDPQFMALGELLNLYHGSIPFVSAPFIASTILSTNTNEMNLNVSSSVPPTNVPNKPMANHLTHGASHSNILLEDALHQIHPMQKQFLLNQQNMAMKSLADSEPWAMLNPEQQAAHIAQRMSQNQSPNSILNNPGIPNPLLNHLMTANNPTKVLPKILNPHLGALSPNTLNKQQQQHQAILKNHQQTQSLQHLLNQHKNIVDGNGNAGPSNGANIPVNMMLPNNDPMQHMLHTMNINQGVISNVAQQPPQNIVEANPIKSLIMQLSMQQQKSIPHQTAPQAQQPPQPLHDVRLQMPATQLNLWDNSLQSSMGSNMANIHKNIIPNASIKTEMHILEQHLHAKAKEEQMSVSQIEQWKKQQLLQQQQQSQQQSTNLLKLEVRYKHCQSFISNFIIFNCQRRKIF